MIRNYLVFEVEGCCSDGTLASFKGIQPIEPVSLVDTDGSEKSLVPKEVKKDIFILQPTKEQLKSNILKYIKTHSIPENDKFNYIKLLNSGSINILKLALTESYNSYKLISEIKLSTIRKGD